MSESATEKQVAGERAGATNDQARTAAEKRAAAAGMTPEPEAAPDEAPKSKRQTTRGAE